MKNRIVLLLCVAALLLPALSVFASGKTETAKQQVNLKWVFFKDGKNKDDALVHAEFNKQLAKYMPNTTVELDAIPYAEYKEKYSLMMAAQENVDLVWTGYLFDVDEEINKGAYLPLNKLLTENAPKLYASKKPENWARFSTNGEIMGYPHGSAGTANILNDIRVIGRIADKYWPNFKADMAKIAAQQGMTQGDYDILAAFLERAKQGGEILKGWDVALGKWAFVDQVMDFIKLPYGIMWTKGDLKVVNQYETADYKLFIDTMSKWYKNGYIIKDIMSIENKRAYEEKEDGNIMFSHGWAYVDSPESQEAYSKGLGFKVYYAPLHNNWYIGNDRANVITAIAKQSKNPVAAIKLLELVQTQETGELATILAYGIEGKHWTKVSEGVPGKTPTSIKTLEYDSSQGTSTASYATFPWAITDNLMTARNQSYIASGEEMAKRHVDAAKVTPMMGFQPQTKEFATEFAQVQAIITEFQYTLEFGTLEDNAKAYNEFLGKLKTAGNDKIIASLQKQLDDFMKIKK